MRKVMAQEHGLHGQGSDSNLEHPIVTETYEREGQGPHGRDTAEGGGVHGVLGSASTATSGGAVGFHETMAAAASLGTAAPAGSGEGKGGLASARGEGGDRSGGASGRRETAPGGGLTTTATGPKRSRATRTGEVGDGEGRGRGLTDERGGGAVQL